jgi:hypothetical protein
MTILRELKNKIFLYLKRREDDGLEHKEMEIEQKTMVLFN